MEFIRQTLETLETGQITQFQLYVVFVWLSWLPNATGAGVFDAFQAPKPVRLTPRYIIALLSGIGLLMYVTYYWALGEMNVSAVFWSVVFAIFVMAPPIRRRIVRLLFAWTFYANHVKVVEKTVHGKRVHCAMMTIFDEDPEFLEQNLKKIRRCLEYLDSDFTLIVIIDGYGRFQRSDDAVPIAKKYADIVMTTNAQHKRTNLYSMYKELRKRGLLATGEELIHFIDSDTIPRDDFVAALLTKAFADPRIGGNTTAQYVFEPETFTQHVCQLLEVIRNHGSQPMLSLFGCVLCLPGRWYVVLAACLTEEDMRGLMTDSFSFFGFMRHPCAAGDDRYITNVILRKGYRTIITLDAVVYTIAPRILNKARLMMTRWARSSGGYNIRETPSYAKLSNRWQWPAAFVAVRNIIMAFWTCEIVYINWPYQVLFGDANIVFWEALVLAFVTMTVVMSIRFSPVWNEQYRYLLFMPLMGPIGIGLQTIQVHGLLTHIHKIGSWGTRAGADDERDSELEVAVLYVRPPP